MNLMKTSCKSRWRILKQALAVVTLIFLFSGCADLQLVMGHRIDPTNIETALYLKESTEDDVKSLFGEPDGVGVYVSPITGNNYTMWTYYFAEGSLKEIKNVTLFFYFDDGIYDGFLWFSSDLNKRI